MKSFSLRCAVVSAILLALSSQSFGWGTKGHETIEEAAIKIMPENNLTVLFKQNLPGMKFLSMVPDLMWKHGPQAHPLEKWTHFFQIDFFVPRDGELHPDINIFIERAGSSEALMKQGTAPWRVEQLAWLLVAALKKQNPNPLEIMQVAATLGHYVGDVGNPLHVATDFDGAGIGEKGLHSFFESKTVDTMPEQLLVPAVKNLAGKILVEIPNNVRPIRAAFILAKHANDDASIVLSTAKRLGQTEALQAKMKPLIVRSLAMSTAYLAKIWTRAYQLAGSPEFPTRDLGMLAVPRWIPVTYIPGIKSQE